LKNHGFRNYAGRGGLVIDRHPKAKAVVLILIYLTKIPLLYCLSYTPNDLTVLKKKIMKSKKSLVLLLGKVL